MKKQLISMSIIVVFIITGCARKQEGAGISTVVQPETADLRVSYSLHPPSPAPKPSALLYSLAPSEPLTLQPTQFHTEEYDRVYEGRFLETLSNPLSTFSIDVDTASYSNMRRFITDNQYPPKDAIRIEELINYFTYTYPQPEDEHPFSVTTELSTCPWNPQHQLVHIGLQGTKMNKEALPDSNLVFLLDVSGSMRQPNKLPLLKRAFRLLVEQLEERDDVAIVVYADAVGLILPPTAGDDKTTILRALDSLQAGGSTAGGQGIQLAYQIAKENFLEGGNNRVILATDGDFNVGISSDAELVRLIESKRREGIFLTILGFGMGNYKDAKMEKLADKGNGNYAYIDNLLEAKKVFVNELGATLFTIAKDVKIQIEFNSVNVKAYRLIGYENRMLAKEDFVDDTKDAGELGAGHTVTALYELIPADSDEEVQTSSELKYQKTTLSPQASHSNELMTVKLRYKQPDQDESTQLIHSVLNHARPLEEDSDNFKFSAAVAEFGMLLRDSEFKGEATYAHVLQCAKEAKGQDEEGYRAEFIRLVETIELLERSQQ